MRSKQEIDQEISRNYEKLDHSWENVKVIIRYKLDALNKCAVLPEQEIKEWHDRLEKEEKETRYGLDLCESTTLRQLKWILQNRRKR